MKFELDTADIVMIIYVLFMFSFGSIFIGSEIATIRFEAEKRAHNATLQKCIKIIVGDTYAK